MISIYIMNMLITVFLMLPAFTNQDKSILKGTPEDLKDAEKKKIWKIAGKYKTVIEIFPQFLFTLLSLLLEAWKF